MDQVEEDHHDERSFHHRYPVALVAGASRGIGADIARAFAAAGYAVVLGARDTAALQHVVDDIDGGRRPSRRRGNRRR